MINKTHYTHKLTQTQRYTYTQFGETALMMAAKGGIAVFQALLEAGADIDIKDKVSELTLVRFIGPRLLP